MITFPDVPGLRPTGDRLRETLFSWLQHSLPESRCLDMFAGSGVLGIEAVSRGAGEVVMLDTSAQVCAQLHSNVEQLGLDNVHIDCADSTLANVVSAYTSGDTVTVVKRFDVVFVDPPFAQQLHQPAIDVIKNTNALADNALVCIESDKNDDNWRAPDDWDLAREKVAGQVRLCLYRVAGNE